MTRHAIGMGRAEAAMSVDVAIAGGGLVGMTLGCALAETGLEVAVVDRESPADAVAAAFDGRVSAIARGSMQVLRSLGLWKGIEADAQPILDIRITDGMSPLFLHYDHDEVGGEPLGWIVENRVTRRVLFDAAARLPTLHLIAPAAVERTESDAHRAVLVLADGRRIAAPLVVAADGKQSPIRRAAGIVAASWSYRQVGIVCTIRHERSHRGVAHERFLPAGPFAMLPMTGDRCSLVWTERRDLADAMMALDGPAFLDEVAWRFGDHLGEIAVVGPRWCYPLAVTLAERYVAHRLALVGDAAHTIHPIAGQGFNLGVRGVAALAESVVDAARLGLDIGADGVLERYQRWRRFDSLLMLGVTDSLNRLFSNDIPPLRVARDLGLAAVDRLPPLKRLFMRHAMGVVGDPPRLVRGEAL